jgi:hypothetical protein
MRSKAATPISLAVTGALLASAALTGPGGAWLAIAAVFVAGLGSVVAGRLRTAPTARELATSRRAPAPQPASRPRRDRRRPARLVTSGR